MADSEGSLKINYGQLAQAADSYVAEEGKFTETTKSLKEQLLAVLSVWQDDSNENWTAKVTKACEDLTAVNELLKANANALSEVSTVAKTSETSVATGVGNL